MIRIKKNDAPMNASGFTGGSFDIERRADFSFTSPLPSSHREASCNRLWLRSLRYLCKVSPNIVAAVGTRYEGRKRTFLTLRLQT